MNTNMMKHNRTALLACLAALALVGCEQKNSNPGAEKKQPGGPHAALQVVATTNIAADLVANIGGDRVQVEALMGPGIDPHLYKAGQGDTARLLAADLVVYNGLHLEGKLVDILASLSEQGRNSVALANAVPTRDLLTVTGSSQSHDPHIWMDVQLWQRAAEYLYEQLAMVDPMHAGQYRQNYAAYAAQLAEVHAYAVSRAAELLPDQRILVTAHDAFGYFGRAYGFEVRGLLGISTASEAGTADVRELATFIADRDIPAIFVESTISDRYLRALIDAVGAQGKQVSIGGQLYADALDAADRPAGTYLGMIRRNMDTIVDALSAGP